MALLLLCQDAASPTQPGPEQLFRSGLVALQNGDLAAARVNLETATQAAPGNARAWAALAQTYRKLHRDPESNQAAGRAEALGPTDPAVLHSLAVYYSEGESFSRAAGLEAAYAILAPQDRDAMLRAMGLYLRAREPKKAIEAASRLPGWETRSDVRNLLGKAWALDEQFDRAATELRQAMLLSPYDEAFIFDAANLALRLEKFDAALSILSQGRKVFDKSPQIEVMAGVAYYGLRRFPEAIDQFLKTIALAPDVEQPYLFLGKMLDQAGERLPQITAQFVQYQQAAPQSYLGFLLHAKALRAAGADAAHTEPLLRQSLALDAGQWEAHFELGVSLESQRKFPEAAQELEKAGALNAKDAVVHYRLARVYDRLGKPDLARKERELHQALLPKTESR